MEVAQPPVFWKEGKAFYSVDVRLLCYYAVVKPSNTLITGIKALFIHPQ